jgi:hypothetical protein
VGLVGAQLGQTLAAGGRDPRVLAASLGGAAAMGLIIATPGVSQLFGCQPLGPVGWGIGLGSAALGTAAAVFIVPLIERRIFGPADSPAQPRLALVAETA